MRINDEAGRNKGSTRLGLYACGAGIAGPPVTADVLEFTVNEAAGLLAFAQGRGTLCLLASHLKSEAGVFAPMVGLSRRDVPTQRRKEQQEHILIEE